MKCVYTIVNVTEHCKSQGVGCVAYNREDAGSWSDGINHEEHTEWQTQTQFTRHTHKQMGFLKSIGQELTHTVLQRHVPIMPGCDPMRIQQAQQFFYMVDTNRTGTLDHHEFGRVLNCMGLRLPGHTVKQYFHSVDVDHSGRIALNEFINWWCMQGQQHWVMVPLGVASPMVPQPIMPVQQPAAYPAYPATYPPVQPPVVYQTPAPVIVQQPAAGFAAGVAAGVMMDEMLHHGHHHHGHHHHGHHHHHHGHHHGHGRW